MKDRFRPITEMNLRCNHCGGTWQHIGNFFNMPDCPHCKAIISPQERLLADKRQDEESIKTLCNENYQSNITYGMRTLCPIKKDHNPITGLPNDRNTH